MVCILMETISAEIISPPRRFRQFEKMRANRTQSLAAASTAYNLGTHLSGAVRPVSGGLVYFFGGLVPRGMYVAVCVLFAGLSGYSGGLAADQPLSAQVASQPIRPLAKELDAIFNRGEYRAKSVQFAWQNEGEIYTI